MKTVLLLTTYPLVEPRHGGQLRACAIRDNLLALGFDVETIALFEVNSYKTYNRERDVSFDANEYSRVVARPKVFLADDYLTIGYSIDELNGGYGKVAEKIKRTIDIVISEQPWLFSLAQKLKAMHSFCRNAMLVYGSQNIEYELKQKIFDQYDMADESDVVNGIEVAERAAARNADLVLAVTEQDRLKLISFGASNAILCPNAISEWSEVDGDCMELRKQLGLEKIPIFVGSAHPPNVKGFFDCFPMGLACLSPKEKLVVAGGVGEHLHADHELYSWLNGSRLIRLGIIEEPKLNALKCITHVFVLPITSGGGSNLKTAEALLSGKYVVATEVAMRGFERYSILPEVFVAKNVNEFSQLLRYVMSLPPSSATIDDGGRRELLWDRALAPLVNELKKTTRT